MHKQYGIKIGAIGNNLWDTQKLWKHLECYWEHLGGTTALDPKKIFKSSRPYT